MGSYEICGKVEFVFGKFFKCSSIESVELGAAEQGIELGIELCMTHGLKRLVNQDVMSTTARKSRDR